MGLRRRLVRAAAVLAVLPLAACGLRGEVRVQPDDLLVDLTLQFPSNGPIASLRLCVPEDWDPATVAVTPVNAPPGQTACRLAGTLSHDAFGPWVHVASSPDVVFVRIPEQVLELAARDGERLEDFDVTFHFPGEVIATSGEPELFGTSVRWTDLELARRTGMNATARLTPAEPVWLVASLAGLVWGLTLTRVAGRLRRPLGPGRSEPGSVGDGEPEPASVPDDPSVWAPDA
ncbi:MAG TPA: hypothetical protein GXZ45_14205 [Propionibacterium sp.]|nr:hypothetical protein [Propionibacterium sp.]